MSGKNILITGTYSGIGRASALTLSAHGFTVYAGILNQAEADAITSLGQANLIPIVLDISDLTSIEAAIETISVSLGATRPLDALVNIAGVNYNAPLQYLSIAEIQQMVNINLLGTILLTRAALPLLRRGKGRVVLCSSATALLPSPAVSVYAATKCGVSGLGDALRVELGLAGLWVSILEPGIIRTPITILAPKILEMMLMRMTPADRGIYEKLMRKIVKLSKPDGGGASPEVAAEIVLHALTAAKPHSRYRFPMDSRAAGVLRHLPDRVRDFIQRKMLGA